MLELVYGQDQFIVPWICNILNIKNPYPCVAIGITRNNQLIGAALYNNLHLDIYGKPLFIEMSFATIDKHWSTRGIISTLLAYPFCQLRVKRVQSTVWKKNRRVRAFLEGLGFKLEGIGRQAWPQGGDACMYSMLNREYFTGKWTPNGKKHPLSTSSARSNGDIGSANRIEQGYSSLQFRA